MRSSSLIVLLSLPIVSSFKIGEGPKKRLDELDREIMKCQSPIYCNGTILRTVQQANLFFDSKQFVDMPSKYSQDEVVKKFDLLGSTPSSDALYEFIKTNFAPPGHELKIVIPKDWNSNPKFLNGIKDTNLLKFGATVHSKWKSLVRRVDFRRICEGCASSVIPLPTAFVVPGGRFREMYYWDSFWILEGLYVSGMCTTASKMIDNFKWMIETYNFIPNGSRTYYLNRSHPPLFPSMVKRHLEECIPKADRVDWLRAILPYLDREYLYWKHYRSVDLPDSDNHTKMRLNRYIADTDLPRPESFLQDVLLGNSPGLDERKGPNLFREISSAAESGLDFTGRWFSNGSANLTHMHTSELIPVDLNSFLYRNEKILAELYAIVGDSAKQHNYNEAAQKRLNAINKVLWNDPLKAWIDYNHVKGHPMIDCPFYLSNLAPLWHGAHQLSSNEIEELLEKHWNILSAYPGGIPFDEVVTGQQWDFPNVWAPFQYYFVLLFEKVAEGSKTPKLWKGRALDVAQRFINATYCGLENYGRHSFIKVLIGVGQFFEKYHAQSVGLPGGGGEYVVQEGFGWTNGVTLWLLKRYGDQLTAPICEKLTTPRLVLRR